MSNELSQPTHFLAQIVSIDGTPMQGPGVDDPAVTAEEAFNELLLEYLSARKSMDEAKGKSASIDDVRKNDEIVNVAERMAGMLALEQASNLRKTLFDAGAEDVPRSRKKKASSALGEICLGVIGDAESLGVGKAWLGFKNDVKFTNKGDVLVEGDDFSNAVGQLAADTVMVFGLKDESSGRDRSISVDYKPIQELQTYTFKEAVQVVKEATGIVITASGPDEVISNFAAAAQDDAEAAEANEGSCVDATPDAEEYPDADQEAVDDHPEDNSHDSHSRIEEIRAATAAMSNEQIVMDHVDRVSLQLGPFEALLLELLAERALQYSDEPYVIPSDYETIRYSKGWVKLHSTENNGVGGSPGVQRILESLEKSLDGNRELSGLLSVRKRAVTSGVKFNAQDVVDMARSF